MSSIAIITDPNMLEFHRFRGSDSIVFWRLGLKQYSRFDSHDLVFFIDRRQRHPNSQEKGVIGFGRCASISNKPLSKAWKLYEQRLGYESESHFKESVRHYRKDDDTLPARIQCIELDKVVLFQYPIFLSEVGFEVSERLESFTYLIKDDVDLTLDLLALAENMGVDAWFSLQNEAITPQRFTSIRQEQELRLELKQLPRIISQKDANALKKYTKGVYYKGLFYHFEGDALHLSYLNIPNIETLFCVYGIHEYLSKKHSVTTTIYAKNSNLKTFIQALNLVHVEI